MGERHRAIAVDFDGVIADYEGWDGLGECGLPRQDVIQALAVLRREGWKIIVHSCRSSVEIESYLLKYSVPYDEINLNTSCQNTGVKPVATVYWDDRAVRYSGDASKDLEEIRKFRTWSGRS